MRETSTVVSEIGSASESYGAGRRQRSRWSRQPSGTLALLFAGFSRSGATMATALVLDLDRVAATRLSFFLGIPALTGAGLYELKDALGSEVGGIGPVP
ncbi:undecaprenyl-diphosphate phosphatase, partial [Nonomuraea sp. NPDC049784]|uniref:undecaprenyl-diphosphate phosphatase n=1 Tax=Nonomuraea sp. NPDC049784 TaxID=3154361 RepID=UPI003403D410